MSSYTHFTLSVRKYLQELQESGYGIRAAARALGRSPSTVSREIRRNGSKSGTLGKNSYHHWRTNTLAVSRCRAKRQPALPENTEKRKYVVEKLWCYWSPEQIAERWKLEHPGENLSFSTIYRYVKKRLSRDDEITGDSNSIVNQKSMLQSYADQHGFANCVHYH